jgi:hypothetical protein
VRIEYGDGKVYEASCSFCNCSKLQRQAVAAVAKLK